MRIGLGRNEEAAWNELVIGLDICSMRVYAWRC
jgi:hypothetical protein